MKRVTVRTASLVSLNIVGVLVATIAADAANTATTCQASKLRASGRYQSCLAGADVKALLNAATPQYQRCVEKIATSWSRAETKAGGSCPGGDGDLTSIQAFLDVSSASVASALSGAPPTPMFSCLSDLSVCSSDLSDCLNACPTAAYVRTGQTTCYDSIGSAVSCPGTGQDGELQKGVSHSFTDNGDGTITDAATHLTWEKLSDDGSIHDKDNGYTWADGLASKVAALNSTNFAGYSDWRVPNVTELLTIVNYGALLPATYAGFNTACVPGCTVLTCSCSSGDTWSSTAYHYSGSAAWLVRFGDGDTVVSDKSNPSYHVRAVRGGS